jgi:hypothetical protein
VRRAAAVDARHVVSQDPLDHSHGWLGMDNKLMVQAAWLEKDNKRWALAVMSDENPTRAYGWDTQKGVTGLLLGQEPTPAYLAVVLE